jgi:hypothetical protein
MSENLHYGPFYQEVSNWVQTQTHGETFFAVLAVIVMIGMLVWTVFFSKNTIPQLSVAVHSKNKWNDRLFIFVCVLVIFVYRALSFYQDQIGHPDEAQLLAAAINVLYDKQLWVTVDTTTLGPVCYLLIALLYQILHFFGIQCDISFFLARLLNTLLIIGSFWFLYKITKKNISLILSRVVVLFFLFFFSFNFQGDLLAYNSESVYLFIFMACLYLLFKIKEKVTFLGVTGTGFLCGLLPFVKLQTLPMLSVYVLWIAFILYEKYRKEKTYSAKKLVLKRFCSFIVAIVMPTILMVLYLSTYKDGLSNAYFYYIENATAHIEGMFSIAFVKHAGESLLAIMSWEWLNSPFLLMAISVLLLLWFKPKITTDCFFSGLLILATLFCIVRSVGPWFHYPIFLIIPSLLLFTTVLQSCSQSNTVAILNYSQKNKNILARVKLVLQLIGAILFIFYLLFSIPPVRFAIVMLRNSLLQHSIPLQNMWHIRLIILSFGCLGYFIFVWLLEGAKFTFVLNTYKLKKKLRNSNTSLAFCFCIVWLLIFSKSFSNISTQTILSNKNMLVGNDKKQLTAFSRNVMAQTKADDCIVVWGREPRIYVYTNRQSATAQCEIDRLCHVLGNYLHKNIDLYVAGIKKNKPRLIVDVVAPGSFIYTEEKYALENHTEVWGAIKNDYELTDIYPVDGGSYKIYTRKE